MSGTLYTQDGVERVSEMPAIPEGFERYRLIPTRGIKGSCWAYASGDDSRELRDFAEAFSADLGHPVLVTRFPERGRAYSLYIVGEDPTERRRRLR